MGMTIEKAYEILSNGLVNASSEHEWCVAFKTAIDTMRKYQKIKEIIDNRYRESVSKTLDEVIKVVDDGNVD